MRAVTDGPSVSQLVSDREAWGVQGKLDHSETSGRHLFCGGCNGGSIHDGYLSLIESAAFP